MRVVVLQRIPLKLGRVVGNVCGQLFEATRPKVEGYLEVKLFWKCSILPPIWWEKTLTEVYRIPGVKGHVEFNRGEPEVKLLRNALWPSNLVERTLDRNGVESHVGVIWGQPEVKLLRNALGPPNLVGRNGVKGHAGVSWGQAWVKFEMHYSHQIW